MPLPTRITWRILTSNNTSRHIMPINNRESGQPKYPITPPPQCLPDYYLARSPQPDISASWIVRIGFLPRIACN